MMFCHTKLPTYTYKQKMISVFITNYRAILKQAQVRGPWLAQSVEHGTLHLPVLSSSPTSDAEITQKYIYICTSQILLKQQISVFSTVKDTKHLQHEKQQCSTPSNELLTPNYHQIKAEFLITPCKAPDHATHRLAPSVPSNVKYSHASSFAHLTPPPSWLTATRPSSLSSSITTLGEPCLRFLA